MNIQCEHLFQILLQRFSPTMFLGPHQNSEFQNLKCNEPNHFVVDRCRELSGSYQKISGISARNTMVLTHRIGCIVKPPLDKVVLRTCQVSSTLQCLYEEHSGGQSLHARNISLKVLIKSFDSKSRRYFRNRNISIKSLK